MNTNLVILAGGLSSRMNAGQGGVPATAVPKSLMALGGDRPFLDLLLDNARQAGYRDVMLVVGERDALFRSFYGSNDRGNDFHGLSISYVWQIIPPDRTKPLGTADALLQALRARPDWKGQKLTVCNSDNLYSVRALQLMRDIAAPCGMVDYDRDGLRLDPERIRGFAVIRKDADGWLVDIVEKPSPEEFGRYADPTGRIGVSMNIWRFTYESILPYLERIPLHPVRREKELPVAVRMMVAEYPKLLMTVPVSEHVPDLTYRSDIADVQAYLRQMRERPDGAAET